MNKLKAGWSTSHWDWGWKAVLRKSLRMQRGYFKAGVSSSFSPGATSASPWPSEGQSREQTQPVQWVPRTEYRNKCITIHILANLWNFMAQDEILNMSRQKDKDRTCGWRQIAGFSLTTI